MTPASTLAKARELSLSLSRTATCGVAWHTATYQVICMPRLSAVDPWALSVCAPSVPHVQWLAWQSTEGGGRIVGRLVAIGATPLATDRASRVII